MRASLARTLVASALVAGLTVGASAGPAPSFSSTTITPAARTITPPPKLPAATWKSVSREVLIPMDDGVKLAATIAWPSRDGATPAKGRFPVVFGITPYGRAGICGCSVPTFWATRGIVGAVVDTRGTGGSGGDLRGNYFSPREARDGAALADWFGTRRWSTGKVGMSGGSYVGITQLLTAELQPKHLTAVAPQVSLSDMYRDAFTHGGIPSAFFDAQYIGVQGGPGALTPNSDPALLVDTVEAKLGQSPPGYIAFDYLQRPNDDTFYRQRSPIYRAGRIKVPVLLIGGWRDGLSQRGGPELFQALAKRKGVQTRLLMDPCTHKGCGAPFAPMTTATGLYDTSAMIWEFMARHLLGRATPARPRVQYYLQGGSGYRAAATWPPATTAYRRYDLGAGWLRPTTAATRATPGTTQVVTDPAAGFTSAFNEYGTVAITPYLPLDQRLEGPHGATFRTGVLGRALTLAGPIGLHLVASSTAADTDFYGKLADVAPDGTETIISEGALRASHRALVTAKSTQARPYHSHVNPTPIEPGRFYRFDIEIWPTAWRLAPGHRLQLRITSDDLPTHLPGWIRFNRADPAATELVLNQPAINTIRYAGSYLVLPVSS